MAVKARYLVTTAREIFLTDQKCRHGSKFYFPSKLAKKAEHASYFHKGLMWRGVKVEKSRKNGFSYDKVIFYDVILIPFIILKFFIHKTLLKIDLS